MQGERRVRQSNRLDQKDRALEEEDLLMQVETLPVVEAASAPRTEKQSSIICTNLKMYSMHLTMNYQISWICLFHNYLFFECENND